MECNRIAQYALLSLVNSIGMANICTVVFAIKCKGHVRCATVRTIAYQIHKTVQFIGKMERHNLNAYHVQFINVVDWFNER